MSAQRLRRPVETSRTLTYVLMGFLWLASSATAEDHCTSITELALNETYRGPGVAQGSRDCLAVFLAEPGILTLSVSTPNLTGVEPSLRFLGAPPSQNARYRLMSQGPRSIAVETEAAGRFFLTVAAEDPGKRLAHYKLRSAFLGSHNPATAEIVFCEPGVVDEEECEVLELDSPIEDSELGLLASCALGETDDHGDTALCATLLTGPSASGKLRNSTGDDEDFFTFVLEAQRSLEIEVQGASCGHLTLYDEKGHRLGASTALENQPARLARTLVPGSYSLRVLSLCDQDELYTLRLEDLDQR